jgi:hypothetical protein
VIETTTFQLAPGADEAAFLDADKTAQTEFAYQQRGLARRTTARGDGGEWIIVTLWDTRADAEAAAARAVDDPAMQALHALVDQPSLRVARYIELDG